MDIRATLKRGPSQVVTGRYWTLYINGARIGITMSQDLGTALDEAREFLSGD